MIFGNLSAGDGYSITRPILTMLGVVGSVPHDIPWFFSKSWDWYHATHRIHGADIYIYGNIYHPYTSNVSINIPAPWIRWVLTHNTSMIWILKSQATAGRSLSKCLANAVLLQGITTWSPFSTLFLRGLLKPLFWGSPTLRSTRILYIYICMYIHIYI